MKSFYCKHPIIKGNGTENSTCLDPLVHSTGEKRKYDPISITRWHFSKYAFDKQLNETHQFFTVNASWLVLPTVLETLEQEVHNIMHFSPNPLQGLVFVFVSVLFLNELNSLFVPSCTPERVLELKLNERSFSFKE